MNVAAAENASVRHAAEVRFFNGLLDEDYGSGRGASGVRITPDTAIQTTAVLGCSRVLAESVAALPIRLYRRKEDGGKERVTDHPLAQILGRQPNGWQTSFEWLETSMLHLCLWGNAYSEIRSGTAGAVSELWPLHPSRMSVERIENGRLRYIYREPDGRETVYTQDQIMHVRWLSSDSTVGMVPVELCREAIGVARACELHAARHFGNGARPGVVLETEANLTAEAARELRQNWERVHRGPDRSGKTAVLMGGLKAHELGQSNESSQFVASRRFQIEEICRVYRCPPHLVQSLERATFSNIEQQSLDFVQHTLLGWIRRWESAIARDLITDDSMFVEMDVRGLLRGDALTRASYYNTMATLGVLSINEIRNLESLNPVPGGDTRLVQLNMTPLQPAEPAAVAAPEPAADGEPVLDTPQLAEVSLNGAQITGIIEILVQVSTGLLDKDAAAALILSAFPSIPPASVDRILTGTSTIAAVPPADEARAEPGEIAEGDWVTWGEGLVGRVDHVMYEGELNLGDLAMPATAAAPVMLVSVWDGWAFSGQAGVAMSDAESTEQPEGYTDGSV